MRTAAIAMVEMAEATVERTGATVEMAEAAAASASDPIPQVATALAVPREAPSLAVVVKSSLPLLNRRKTTINPDDRTPLPTDHFTPNLIQI
jgi:hypothetical protein